jgi:DNA-binding NtrC family response regulator
MEKSTILVIDDEPNICRGCEMALSGDKYSVESTTSGNTGLNKALENKYDLILLDLRLPDKDGMEILNTLRKKQPGSYVIIMTGFSTVANAVKAMKSGAFDYIAKPFSEEELTHSVGKAIENKRLKEENLLLREQIFKKYDFSNIVGSSPSITRVFNEILKVAHTDSTVLICGESGTGKELFAKATYTHSQRADHQFIAVDCSTFSSSLLESELFGHVKGAFTGANHDKKGIFEMANKGTLFLDEVSNLDMKIQGKLLRVMETQEFKPVGASQIRKTDTRFIAATNQDLKAMVDQGDFREDFFYRLNVFPVFLPSLRERKGDIPMLIYHFLKTYCRKTGKKVKGFSDDALEIMVNYDWPGNIRQLKNTVERCVIMADHNILDRNYLSEYLETKKPHRKNLVPETLEELKLAKRHILENEYGQIEIAFLQNALSVTNGNISQAASRAGMQRSNFSTLMKKHHLSGK